MSRFAPPSLHEQKQHMREEMREKRRANQELNPKHFRALADNFLNNIALPEKAVIGSYCAFRDEMDPATLSESLRAKGHLISLPIITRNRDPLIFRLYEQGDLLLANPMGIFEPASTAQGIEPDVVLVPLLAFDEGRNRLGYGGGFYDRTLSTLRAKKPILAIGIAYAYQQVAQIPIGPNDIPLDKIVTETKVF